MVEPTEDRPPFDMAVVLNGCPCRKFHPVGVRAESDDALRVDLCRLIVAPVIDLFRPRAAVEAEILVLRQQIIVLRRGSSGRVPFLAVDRMVLAA
jgi:hypothetical protein